MDSEKQNLGECKLCLKQKNLQSSHIIPRSYYKYLKKESSQLVYVVCDSDSIPKLENSDPKERLLCYDCEQFFNHNFEKYGTRLFSDRRAVTKHRNHIAFSGFKYNEFYLFLISIFWRASISSLKEFSSVNLGENLNKIMADCLIKKSIKFNTSLKLDNFIRVSILRIVDSTGNIDDEIIKKVLINFNYERGKHVTDGMVYYFMVHGFFICFCLKSFEDIHDVRTFKVTGQITNRYQLKIPKVQISEIKQINEAFRVLSEKSRDKKFQ